MRIFLIVGLIMAYILLPVASAEIQYTITPGNPVIGDTITIIGTGALPNGFVYPSITFETDVEVKNSMYEFKISGISIPSENYNFKLTASPVDNLSINARPAWLPIGLTYNGKMNGNKGSISHGHIIVPANYDIKIHGKSHNDGVNLKITTTARIQSDSTGGFRYQYQTAGLPSGEYSVEISGIEKDIELKSESIQMSTITSIESSASVPASTEGTSGKVQTNATSNEESVTSEATPEMTTASEKTVPDKPVTSSAVPEQKSILKRILEFLKL